MKAYVRITVTVVVVAVLTSPATATPQILLDATPEQALAAAYVTQELTSADQQSALGMLLSLLVAGHDVGVMGDLDLKDRLWIEALRSWPVAQRYPRAYVLNDIGFRTVDDHSNRLAKLDACLILVTGDDHLLVEQHIQYLLNKFTASDTTRLEPREVGGHAVHRLVDSRLPSWAVLEWGRLDELYVLGLGRGSVERVLRATGGKAGSLRADSWFAEGHKRVHGPQAKLEVYADADTLYERLGNSAGSRLKGVLESFELQEADRMIWTVGSQQRALTSYAYLLRDGQSSVVGIAEPQESDAGIMQHIPAQATWYGVMRRRPAETWSRLKNAYLAIYRPEDRARLIASARSIEQQAAVDHGPEILSQLGDHVIIHNYPVHPLGFGLMCTILVEIDGDAKQVQAAIYRLFQKYAVKLQAASRHEKRPLVVPELYHDSDGVWYLQAGLYGPALAVTERYLIISYSPPALRANFSSRVGQSSAPPTPQPAEDRASPTAGPTTPQDR